MFEMATCNCNCRRNHFPVTYVFSLFFWYGYGIFSFFKSRSKLLEYSLSRLNSVVWMLVLGKLGCLLRGSNNVGWMKYERWERREGLKSKLLASEIGKQVGVWEGRWVGSTDGWREWCGASGSRILCVCTLPGVHELIHVCGWCLSSRGGVCNNAAKR